MLKQSSGAQRAEQPKFRCLRITALFPPFHLTINTKCPFHHEKFCRLQQTRVNFWIAIQQTHQIIFTQYTAWHTRHCLNLQPPTTSLSLLYILVQTCTVDITKPQATVSRTTNYFCRRVQLCMGQAPCKLGRIGLRNRLSQTGQARADRKINGLETGKLIQDPSIRSELKISKYSSSPTRRFLAGIDGRLTSFR